jgi:hypothetical protein
VQDSLRFQVHLVLLMIAVVLVLNVAHLVEVAVWALLYSCSAWPHRMSAPSISLW